MIARVVVGRLRTDVDEALRMAAWEQATKAHEGLVGFHGVHFLEPANGQEGVLCISFWDTVEDAVRAVSGPKLWGAMGGFSTLLALPPCTAYYPIKATA